MKINMNNISPEKRDQVLLEAVARVYAAGLISANTTAEDIRNDIARGHVDDFLAKIEELST